jgi:hypothetical protein
MLAQQQTGKLSSDQTKRDVLWCDFAFIHACAATLVLRLDRLGLTFSNVDSPSLPRETTNLKMGNLWANNDSRVRSLDEHNNNDNDGKDQCNNSENNPDDETGRTPRVRLLRWIAITTRNVGNTCIIVISWIGDKRGVFTTAYKSASGASGQSRPLNCDGR